MKKTLSFLLCAMLCISTLCACTTDKTETSNTSVGASSVDISYGDVSYIIPEGNDSSAAESQAVSSGEFSESSDPSTETSADVSQPFESDDSSKSNTSTETSKPAQQTGGFAIKLAKYAYESNAVALLNITNETDKNYSITIYGSYLDANGNVLKTETQKWEQFEAGYQKFFLFKPDIQFDRFTYSLETAEFKGECPVCDFGVKSIELCEVNMPVPELCNQGDRANHPQIIVKICRQNNSNKKLYVGMQHVIVIGSDGEIYKIILAGSKEYIPGHETYNSETVFYTTEDKIEWPKELKGKVNVIVVSDEIRVME